MATATVSEAQFIALFRELQSPSAVAKAIGVSERNVRLRKRRIEERNGIVLPVFDKRRPQYNVASVEANRAVVRLTVTDGVVLIGSDAHIWPGPLTTMQRAFLHFAKRLRPFSVIANGDFFDGSRVSRFDHSSWTDMERKPAVSRELEAVKDFMGEVVKAAPAAKRIWTLGNHDARYESRLVSAAPEYVGVHGTRLKDHFPEWIPCWRVDINDDVVVRHREYGGESAGHKNAVYGGKTIVTGHDHRAGVTPYHDYTGMRWGVRCGYMAESPEDDQFRDYLECKAPNWHPAFAVLTFKGGRLLWPELVTRHDDGAVEFRGEVINV